MTLTNPTFEKSPVKPASPPDVLPSVNRWTALRHRYGFVGLCSLFIDLVLTRICFRPARLVRRPIELRGKRWITFGRGFTTGRGVRIEALPKSLHSPPCIEIGENVQINDYVHIAAALSVKIGSGTLIASKVFISDHNHGTYGNDPSSDAPTTPPACRPLSTSAVVIEDDVWIGESVCVLPGVRIGRGSVIGASSVVTRSIPSFCIAVGSPARVIKRYSFESKQWEQLLDRGL
jgi:acetyltransferase-like isoleucine patch superfamily enzyme